jgi:ADP-heptose:LPS heptosyltransferase
MRHLFSWKEPKTQKTCGIVRYGIIGDLIIMSSILPGLKKQGFHITLYTNDLGWETVKYDPHIDRVILQDGAHIPNHELMSFFNSVEPKYDKWINLCESVETNLLALTSNLNARFTKEARHMLMDVNYLEFTHALAGVPFVPSQTFYMTQEEVSWAKKTRDSIGGDFIVIWALAGSAIHKCWPHMDEIFRRLLTIPGVRIVTLGDQSAQMLEAGWEEEGRVFRRAGRWSIRESLSFLSQADLIIGPETGIMNVASMMSTPKIVLLSHSSIENLTKHWVNTVSLTPKNTPCYPCHILHKGFEFCKPGFLPIEGEMTQVGSHCQVDISPDQMWEAIIPNLKLREAA